MALRKSLPWSPWFKEIVRDCHTFLLRFDPITRSACANATVVYARTRHTAAILPKSCRDKMNIKLELGTPLAVATERSKRPAGAPLRIMYAGQFVYWKGMHLGLRAVAAAKAGGHDVRLTMVGSGPDEGGFRDLVDALDIGDIVTWRGQVSHAEIGAIYCEHDAFLFPSLHDSSGNVVLEAITRGLPVICLDLCGPAEIITQESGRIVTAVHSSEADCVNGLADAIGELAQSPQLCAHLSEGALLRSQQFLWPRVVKDLYGDVERRLEKSEALAAPLRQSCAAT